MLQSMRRLRRRSDYLRLQPIAIKLMPNTISAVAVKRRRRDTFLIVGFTLHSAHRAIRPQTFQFLLFQRQKLLLLPERDFHALLACAQIDSQPRKTLIVSEQSTNWPYIIYINILYCLLFQKLRINFFNRDGKR